MKRTGRETIKTISTWRKLGNCTDESEMLKLMDELGIETEDDELYSYYDDTPEGCKACGGPYPECQTSCKLFDD